MIISPKIRGFICTTAHPQGCRAHVLEQINYAKANVFGGVKNVLVIGASTGYGLSSLIAAAFSAGANTLGVSFDKPAANGRTATAGWYNLAAFVKEAKAAGLGADVIIGDAFSNEVKQATIERIKRGMGKVDTVIYSIASPVRTVGDERYFSVIKPVGEPYVSKSVDIARRALLEATVQPATEEETQNTVKVMGGEDWLLWTEALKAAGVLQSGFTTLAFSYIGPTMTHPIYRDGTIGQAKNHLYDTAKHISKTMDGSAYISVNKALVTQASAAIPVVPLYISVLYQIMKQRKLHEGCIEQMVRMFKKLESPPFVDESGQIRMDDYEMSAEIQAEVSEVWGLLNDSNLEMLLDLDGYNSDFLKLFGFGMPGVDYGADVDENVTIDGAIII